MFPDNIYLQLAVARIYLEAGEIELMIKVCEKILCLLDLPADLLIESISQVAELFIGIAEKLLQEKKFESFDVAFELAKYLRPESTEGLKELSQLAFDLSEHERGVKVLEAVLAIDPGNPQALSLMRSMLERYEGIGGRMGGLEG